MSLKLSSSFYTVLNLSAFVKDAALAKVLVGSSLLVSVTGKSIRDYCKTFLLSLMVLLADLNTYRHCSKS